MVVDLFLFEPIIEVKCSLIDQYVKKQSVHGMFAFNGSNVITFLCQKIHFLQYYFNFNIKNKNKNFTLTNCNSNCTTLYLAQSTTCMRLSPPNSNLTPSLL